MGNLEVYGIQSKAEYLPFSSERVLCEQRLQYVPSQLQSTNASTNEKYHRNWPSCVSFVGSNYPVSTSIHQRETFYEPEECVTSRLPAVQSRNQVSSIDSVPCFDDGIIRNTTYNENFPNKLAPASPSQNASTILDVSTSETTQNREDDASSNHDSNVDGQCSSSQTSKLFPKKPSRSCSEPGRSMLKDFLVDSVLPTADEVGLLWKISELRVELQASERARHSGELEMEAMRKYISKVEAAAAGLSHRIQQLENTVLCLNYEGKNIEEVQGKLVEESTKTVRYQGAVATAAVEAAREATMELDKVRRYSSSIIKSQEEEIKRLSIEMSHYHLLYQARGRRLQNLKDQFEKLELMNSHQSKVINAAIRASNTAVLESPKVFYDAKIILMLDKMEEWTPVISERMWIEMWTTN